MHTVSFCVMVISFVVWLWQAKTAVLSESRRGLVVSVHTSSSVMGMTKTLQLNRFTRHC